MGFAEYRAMAQKRPNFGPMFVSPYKIRLTNTPGRSRMVKNTEKSLVGNKRRNVVLLVIDNKFEILA